MTTTKDVAALDDRFVSEWGRCFLEAWNGLDGPAVATLCTADVIWTDPSAPEPLIGRPAVSDFVQRTGAAFPDLLISETAPPCVVPGTARVLAPYRMAGTMRGPVDGLAPTGRPISLVGVDEWTFRGGLLSAYCTYYDTIDAARQLGILPPAGSRTDRIMTRLQHLHAAVQRHSSATQSQVRP